MHTYSLELKRIWISQINFVYWGMKNPINIIQRQKDIISELRGNLHEACRAADIYKEECIRERQRYNEVSEKLHYTTVRLEVEETRNREIQHKYHERLREAFNTTR